MVDQEIPKEGNCCTDFHCQISIKSTKYLEHQGKIAAIYVLLGNFTTSYLIFFYKDLKMLTAAYKCNPCFQIFGGV